MPTGLTAVAANRIFNRQTSATRGYPWIQLHTGDPGRDGTANRAGNQTRKLMYFTTPAAGSGVSRENIVWSDSEVTTTETYTHVSFWSAEMAGEFGNSGTLNSAEVDASEESFRMPLGSYRISFAIAS